MHETKVEDNETIDVADDNPSSRELARLFAPQEQLCRAGTISRGEPYHHD